MTKRFSLIWGLSVVLIAQGALPLLALSSQEEPSKVLLNGFVQETLNEPSTTQPEYGIVGLEMLIRAQAYPVVQHVFRGSPAAKAGIQVGDMILAVNGHSTWGKSLSAVDEQISNIPGTEIHFAYYHQHEINETSLRVASLQEVSAELKSIYSPALTNR